MTAEPFTRPACGECANLEAKEINPGVRYCWALMTWRLASTRPDCKRFIPKEARDAVTVP